jgi:hypothetical protein
MLISRRDGQLKLVTQPDHGRLAGALAEQWGNAEFEPAALQATLIYTAAYHDDGWQALDAGPVWEPHQQRPAHFLEVPLPVVTAAYTDGVDAMYEAAPLAGALVSMHFTGFFRSRWGMDDAPHVDHPDVPGIVTHEEQRKTRAIRDSWPADQPRADFERDIWHSYEILQVLDLLSLFICLVDLSRESTAETHVMARTLFSIDQEPTRRTILRAPRTNGGDRVDLTVSLTAPNVVAVDPYPFADAEISVEVPARVLEDRPYTSADEAAEAYRAAPVETHELSVVGVGPALAPEQTKATR